MSVLSVAEKEVQLALGIDWDTINQMYATTGATDEYRALSIAATVMHDTVDATRRKVDNDELSVSDLGAILDKTYRDWIRTDYYPDMTRADFFGNEKLCWLLMQGARIAFTGFKDGSFEAKHAEEIEEIKKKMLEQRRQSEQF